MPSAPSFHFASECATRISTTCVQGLKKGFTEDELLFQNDDLLVFKAESLSSFIYNNLQHSLQSSEAINTCLDSLNFDILIL